MIIRRYEPGDEADQVEIYNAAAAHLPRFKPATQAEVKRRVGGRNFDPETRFYAEENGRVIGYASWAPSGRVGYPWCRPGFEHCAPALFAATLQALREQAVPAAWAAYRGDWPEILGFFEQQGFTRRRQMFNFTLELLDMPTPSGRGPRPETPLRREDLPDLLTLCPGLLRVRDIAELETHLFENPYFPPESVYVLRNSEGRVRAAALLVNEPTYPDPRMVDADMPCFRLGAWGTEGLTHKRLQGMFSVLIPPVNEAQRLALDLLVLAAERLAEYDVERLAAQVNDAHPHLVRFYRNYFRPQGSFPILERDL